MVRLYKVYCGQRYIGTYSAKSEKEAMKKAQSAQAGNAQHLYRAEVVKNDSN